MDIHLHIGKLVIDLPSEKIDKILELVIDNNLKLKKMSKEMDDLEAKVAAQETVEASAIALLTGIAAELKAALANNDTPRIVALSAKLSTDTQTLADAVSANTPAATAPPVAATPPPDTSVPGPASGQPQVPTPNNP